MSRHLNTLWVMGVVVGGAASFAGCSSNPVAEDKSFDSKRTAEIVPIPVEVDNDLTRVYIKKNGSPGDPTPAAAPLPTASGPAAALPPGVLVAAPPSLDSKSVPERPETKEAAIHGKRKNGRGRDGGIVHYRVKRSDTLMKISFAVLGDLRRWREILELNPGKVGKLNTLTPGTVLKIRVTRALDIDRNGDPYLIHWRDTLLKISDHLYGTPRKWWALWDNNRQLIHDPNRIYAGFTLYYVPNLEKHSFTQESIKPPEVLPALEPDSTEVARAPAGAQVPEVSGPVPTAH